MSTQSAFSELVRARSSARKLIRTRDYTVDVLDALNDARHAPSPFNVQPWRFVVLDDPKALARLCEASYGQKKVADAGTAVVFLAHLSPEASAGELEREAALRESDAAKQAQRCAEIYGSRRGAIGDNGVARELRESTFLAAMIFMLSLSERGIASCPVGGFDADAVSELLGLPPHLEPVLVIAAGDADGSDSHKPRLPLSVLLHTT